MHYMLHGADPELWAWVKARAYIHQLTINQYVMILLTIAKDGHEKGNSITHIIDSLKPSLLNL